MEKSLRVHRERREMLFSRGVMPKEDKCSRGHEMRGDNLLVYKRPDRRVKGLKEPVYYFTCRICRSLSLSGELKRNPDMRVNNNVMSLQSKKRVQLHEMLSEICAIKNDIREIKRLLIL